MDMDSISIGDASFSLYLDDSFSDRWQNQQNLRMEGVVRVVEALHARHVFLHPQMCSADIGDEYAYCIPHPVRKPKYTKVKVRSTQDKQLIS